MKKFKYFSFWRAYLYWNFSFCHIFKEIKYCWFFHFWNLWRVLLNNSITWLAAVNSTPLEEIRKFYGGISPVSTIRRKTERKLTVVFLEISGKNDLHKKQYSILETWLSCVSVKESEIFAVTLSRKMHYASVGFWLGLSLIPNGRCHTRMKTKNGLKRSMDENWIMNCLVFFVARIWHR